MSEHQRRFEREQAEIEALERSIYAARNYVAPSRDLRPRTIEAAQEFCRQKRRVRRLSFGAIAAAVAWIICMPAASTMSGYSDRISGPSRFEMERAALDYAQEKGYGPNWGLVEAFLKVRNVHQEKQ